MRLAGQGALYEAFLRLRDKLAAEGLFEASIKRPLPAYPRAIGIVTSLAAAALRDILSTLQRRNPSVPVIIYPSAVQGEGAAAQLTRAVQQAGERKECDVLIIARGGGSIEDLWAFNDEALARAIRNCPMPVISGVGHETDFTIADFASDQRAPTPTAAAELAAPSRSDLLREVANFAAALQRGMARQIDNRTQRLDLLTSRLGHPDRRIAAQGELLAQLLLRLSSSTSHALEGKSWRMAGLVQRSRARLPQTMLLGLSVSQLVHRLCKNWSGRDQLLTARLGRLNASLAHLDPSAVLARGYSVIRDTQGRVITRGRELAAGELLDVTLAEGGALVRVERPH
jgi:exodeoxyribonuclease VII large subunit